VRSLDQYRWLGAQVGERMDLIRRGEHQSGTCLSRGCRNAVRLEAADSPAVAPPLA
jgi:hypothetical protein